MIQGRLGMRHLGQRCRRIGQKAILVFHLATRSQLISEPRISTQQEILAFNAAHIDAASLAARADQFSGLVQMVRDLEIKGHGIARAARQNGHRGIAADNPVHNLHLSAVPTISGHQIHATGNSLTGLPRGVAGPMGDTGVPVNLVLTEYVIDDIQDRLVATGSRVDDNVNSLVWYFHLSLPNGCLY